MAIDYIKALRKELSETKEKLKTAEARLERRDGSDRENGMGKESKREDVKIAA